jgi:hypothetical protein
VNRAALESKQVKISEYMILVFFSQFNLCKGPMYSAMLASLPAVSFFWLLGDDCVAHIFVRFIVNSGVFHL